MYQQVIEKMKQKLEEAGLYPLQKQAELSTRILEERLETVLPWAMEESGMDFWMVLSVKTVKTPSFIRCLPGTCRRRDGSVFFFFTEMEREKFGKWQWECTLPK